MTAVPPLKPGEFDRRARQLGAYIIMETGVQLHLDPPLTRHHAGVNVRMIIPIKKVPKNQGSPFRRWSNLFNRKRIQSQGMKAGVHRTRQFLIPAMGILILDPSPAPPTFIPRTSIPPSLSAVCRIPYNDTSHFINSPVLRSLSVLLSAYGTPGRTDRHTVGATSALDSSPDTPGRWARQADQTRRPRGPQRHSVGAPHRGRVG